MDIKDKLTIQEKQAFENLRVEMLVLEKLLNEKRGQAHQLLTITLQKLGYNLGMYVFEFNAHEDKWDVKLRADVISLPGQNFPLSKRIKGN